MNPRHQRSNRKFLPSLAAMTLTVAVSSLAFPRIGHAGTADDARLLIQAVRAGRIAIVQDLVKDGADINARAPGDGTALIVASKRGKLKMVNALIKLGADVNQASRGDGNPLIAASMTGQLDVAKRLIGAGARVNAIVAGDETPLINASRNGHLIVVEYLVAHGANANLGVCANRIQWRTPLNQAADAAVRNYLVRIGASPRKATGVRCHKASGT